MTMISRLSSFLVAAATVVLHSAVSISAQNLDPNVDLDSLGNNTLFTKWRPTFHFMSPAGWMNDPCGAMYDPTKDEYHLFYQWHNNHAAWGNDTWGHAVSKDLIDWIDVGGWKDDQAVAIAPGPKGSHDALSIFSGTAQSVNLHGKVDGTLLAMYTGVSALPTNWKKPYIKGTETQSLAVSYDGGKTWEKFKGNPIIRTPPEGWNITGWRDPFFEPWPEMDLFLNQKEPHFYMVMGSGIKNVGPRIPLYSAKASDLTNWTFLGALWEPGMNESFGDVEKTGSFGYNFEVSGFFSLTDDDGNIHYYSTMGTEGGEIPSHPRTWSLWSEGAVKKRDNGSVEFDIVSTGPTDWGNLYAMTSFKDTKNNRRIAWGWSEEDMNNYGARAQGFQGAMGLPRELFVKKTYNVLSESGFTNVKTNSYSTQHSNGTFTTTTLGTRPLPDVIQALRNRAAHKFTFASSPTTYSHSGPLSKNNTALASDHFELSARIINATGPVGFTVRSSPTSQETTTIIYDPTTSSISINRSKSSLIRQFNNRTVTGYYHAPRILSSPSSSKNTTGIAAREPVDINIFVDGSLIEVFAGGKFALTTRVYPSRDDALRIGVYVEDGASAVVEELSVWTGLGSVWPERPRNSSSRLVWDSPEVTGNYTWWDGW